MNLPPPIPLDEAQARLLALADPLGSEAAAVERSVGCYLGADLVARRTQPPADLSAMDGYAVRGDELEGPWRLVGESAAGYPFAGSLAAGEAVRISTGALMPDGGGAILLQENATRNGEQITLNGEGSATDRHIRRAGFDFAEDDNLLPAGALLGPTHIALAIAAGHSAVEVGTRAKVAIIDSGDELAADPALVRNDQIPASNGPMLAAMAAPWSSLVVRLGPVPDRLQAITSAFEQSAGCDVIVTSGGASVGDHDLIRPALEQWGAGIDFWRVAMRPGKPLLVARKGKQLVLGLPGNPVSSFVTAYIFLLPLLRRMAGSIAPLPQALTLPLLTSIDSTGPRTEFLRGSITPDGVLPIHLRDSSAVRSLAAANCLIRRDAGAPAAAAGEMATIYRLENGGIA